MEKLYGLSFSLGKNIFQAAILLFLCFDLFWKINPWMQMITLLAATGNLVSIIRDIPPFYYCIRSEIRSKKKENSQVQAERNRIASDLHDMLGGQLVYALSLIDSDDQRGRSLAKEVLEQSLLNLRLIVDSMDAHDDGFVTGLARLRHRLEPVMRRKGVALWWHVNAPDLTGKVGVCSPLPVGRMATQLLAVVQEALCNALSHADATEIWVTLEPYEKGDVQGLDWNWSLSIEDNGKGFDLNSVLADASKCGHGMASMFRRMKDVGGDLHLHPRQGGGTRVQLRWQNS